MRRLLGDAIAAGGLGFSTANVATQVDGDGRPTPPNFATREELVALAAVCGEHPGTSIEFIPDSFLRGFSDDDIELMAAMSAAANRPLNWNTPLINRNDPTLYKRQLRASDVAAERAGASCRCSTRRTCRSSTTSSRGTCSAPCPAGAGCSSSTHRRGWPRSATRSSAGGSRSRRPRRTAGLAVVVRNWATYRVNEVPRPELAPLVGRSIADLAAECGDEPLRRMVEVALRCDLRVGFVRPQYPDEDDWVWRARLEVLKDPRVILQASDAGAHLDMMAGANFPTRCIAELVRGRGAFTIEEMVRQLTSVPADLYGLVDRGRIARGAWADIVVFDPATVGRRAARDRPRPAGRRRPPHDPCRGRRPGHGRRGRRRARRRVHRRRERAGAAVGSRHRRLWPRGRRERRPHLHRHRRRGHVHRRGADRRRPRRGGPRRRPRRARWATACSPPPGWSPQRSGPDRSRSCCPR